MSVTRRLVPALLLAIGFASFAAREASACSALAEPPTLKDLGPNQVVVVGTIGDRIPSGRVFHVERWFNGAAPMTPIIIAFKEGPAVGDCSYPVATGQRLIIAPEMGADGTLAAMLPTLQADPNSDQGRAYLAEAVALYGEGVALEEQAAPGPVAPTPPSSGLVISGLVGAVAVLFGAVAVIARRRTPS